MLHHVKYSSIKSADCPFSVFSHFQSVSMHFGHVQ